METNIDIARYAMDKKIKAWQEAGAFPACSYGVTAGVKGTLIVNRPMKSPEGKLLWKQDIFDLASLTKVVGTVPAILHLIETGDLTLETKMADFLPEAGESLVTIRQCMSHTSGAPADFPYQDLKGKEAVIKRAASLLPDHGNAEICYSDINYILLGEVVERASGMGLDQAFREWIFEPLHMKSTGFFPDKEKTLPTEMRSDRGLVWGEAHDGKAYAMGGISGHAGLFSTGEDIIRFIRGILGVMTDQKGHFLSRASIDLMAREQAVSGHDRRGLGWILPYAGGPTGDLCSGRALFHTGFTGGSILIDLDRKAGCFLLTNRVHPSRENRAILDLRPRFNNMAMAIVDDLRSMAEDDANM